MPRTETSRQNLEKARARLAEIIAQGKAKQPQVEEEDEAVYNIGDIDQDPPAAKKAKKEAPPKKPEPESESDSGSESGSSSDDEDEKEPAAKNSTSRKVAAKKPARTSQKRKMEEYVADLIKGELGKHMSSLRNDVRSTVLGGAVDFSAQKVLLQK